jgi:hypothetical protein
MIDVSDPQSCSLPPKGSDQQPEPFCLLVKKADTGFGPAARGSGEPDRGQTHPRPFWTSRRLAPADLNRLMARWKAHLLHPLCLLFLPLLRVSRFSGKEVALNIGGPGNRFSSAAKITFMLLVRVPMKPYRNRATVPQSDRDRADGSGRCGIGLCRGSHGAQRRRRDERD